MAGRKQREKEFSLQFKFEKPGRAGVRVQLRTDDSCQRDEGWQLAPLGPRDVPVCWKRVRDVDAQSLRVLGFAFFSFSYRG